jgi:Ribosomal proteins 50S-L18Ae/60S-L20/60S-L18A
MRQYQVVGRKAPTEADPNPPAYRMKVFSATKVGAISSFWYLIHQMRKMKKTTGEILDVNEVSNAAFYVIALFSARSSCISIFAHKLGPYLL